MQAETPKPPKLLFDAPAEADEFGGHDEVASAIVSLINGNLGGYALALEGEWGSGKSTVVTLLRDKLASDSNHIFVFDAWAHQGDPLRRSFLESLGGSLKAHNTSGEVWIRPEELAELGNLSGRQHDSTRTTTSRVSLPAKLAALGALAVPIGLVILNRQLDQLDTSGVSPGWLTIGAGATLMPLLLGAVGVLVSWRSESHRKADPESRPGLLDPWVGKSEVHEESTSIDAIDPTSIEFESLFSKLMEQALVIEARRVIIVFDNLDRVAPDDALNMLATMQTFLGRDAPTGGPWHKRLWIIVPFDRSRLNTILHREASSDFQSAVDARPAARDSTDAAEQFDKLFLVTFHVPPMLLADWRSYLRQLTAHALPSEAMPEVVRAAAVYGNLRARQGRVQRRETPRRLKRLVNDLVVLRLQHPDIELALLMYFAAESRRGTSIESILLDKAEVATEVQGVFGADFKGKLASLYFGRPQDRAMHELIRDEVEHELVSGDAESFSQRFGIPGIWEVVSELPYDSWMALGGESIGLVAETLHTSASIADAKIDITENLAEIWRGFGPDQRFEPRSDTGGRGIARMWMAASDGQSAADAFRRLGDPADYDHEPAESVLDRAQGLVGFLSIVPAADLLASGAMVELATTPMGYLELAGFINSHSEDLPAALITSNCGASEIDGTAANALQDDPTLVVSACPILGVHFTGHDFPQLRTAAQTNLGIDQPLGLVWQSVAALRALGGPAQVDLRDVVASGSLHHFIGAFLQPSEYPAGAAHLFLAIAEADPSLPSPPAVGSSTVGYESMLTLLRGGEAGEVYNIVLDEVALLTCSAETTALLIQVWQFDRTRAGLSKVLTSIVDTQAGSSLGSRFIADNWSTLAFIVDPEVLGRAAELFRNGGELEEACLQVALAGDNASLAVRLLSGQIERQQEVARWTSAALNALSQEDWKGAFTRVDDWIRIILKRKHAGLPASLDYRYQAALTDYLQDVVNGDTESHVLTQDDMIALIECLGDRQPVALAQLANQLSLCSPVTLNFASSWSHTLFRFPAFCTAPEIPVLLANAVVSGDPEMIRWVSRTISDYPEIARAAHPEKLAYFKSNLHGAKGASVEADQSVEAELDRCIDILHTVLKG